MDLKNSNCRRVYWPRGVWFASKVGLDFLPHFGWYFCGNRCYNFTAYRRFGYRSCYFNSSKTGQNSLALDDFLGICHRAHPANCRGAHLGFCRTLCQYWRAVGSFVSAGNSQKLKWMVQISFVQIFSNRHRTTKITLRSYAIGVSIFG